MAKVADQQSTEKRQGLISQTQSYLSESVDELKKVTRPTSAEARQATIVTVILVVIVAAIISLFDLVFAQVMKLFVY